MYKYYSCTTFKELFENNHIIKCPLPEDVLEKITYLGLSNSKEVLKEKIKEAFDHWISTEEIDVRILPILLIATAINLNIIDNK